ncbi:hypothetical protein M8494_36000 [Serratia ureilytica]
MTEQRASRSNMVSDAVDAMKRREFLDKVVLSRLLEIETRQPVDRHALMARVIAPEPARFPFPRAAGAGVRCWAPPRLLLRRGRRPFLFQPAGAGSARREADPQRIAKWGSEDGLGERSPRASHRHRACVTPGRPLPLPERAAHPELLATDAVASLHADRRQAASPDEMPCRWPACCTQRRRCAACRQRRTP